MVFPLPAGSRLWSCRPRSGLSPIRGNRRLSPKRTGSGVPRFQDITGGYRESQPNMHSVAGCNLPDWPIVREVRGDRILHEVEEVRSEAFRLGNTCKATPCTDLAMTLS